MIIPIDVKKIFEKTEHSFLIKTLKKTGFERCFPSIKKKKKRPEY